MSPLTKLFVVLLVITSMLTTTGFVVFVEALKPLQPQLEASRSAVASAQDQAARNLEAKQQAEDQLHQEITAHQDDRARDAADRTTLQGKLNEAKVDNATLQAEKTNLQATINTLNSNLALTTATSNKLQDQVTTLRKTNDELVKRAEETNRRLSELTATDETLASSYSQLQEKLQAELEKEQKLDSWVKGHGGDADSVANNGEAQPTGVGAPAIAGRVSEKRVLDGNVYVTINVGSADGVSRGMQFYVVDPDSGQFLAILTIDTVDTSDAIGKLAGDADKVAQVRAGNDVKTQLRGS